MRFIRNRSASFCLSSPLRSIVERTGYPEDSQNANRRRNDRYSRSHGPRGNADLPRITRPSLCIPTEDRLSKKSRVVGPASGEAVRVPLAACLPVLLSIHTHWRTSRQWHPEERPRTMGTKSHAHRRARARARQSPRNRFFDSSILRLRCVEQRARLNARHRP